LRNRAALRLPVATLNRWNARHPWSHNDPFHGWVLRNLPARRASALDVGCGRGALVARLAERFDRVTRIDPDPEMVAASRRLVATAPGAEIRQESLRQAEGQYDAVTAIASLHHLSFGDALTRAKALVAPGGRLLVVGLARLGSPVDIAYDSASLMLNPLVGLVKHPRPVRGGSQPPGMPVRAPIETFDEIGALAERVLPGARLRRRLFFRYTLAWDSSAL
jgi:SAM-dependent methyltransferase